MKTVKTGSALFGQEFEECLILASPFMSIFLKILVAKRQKESEKSTSQMHDEELYEECVDAMAMGIEFHISAIVKNIGDSSVRIKRLRKIVDDLIIEAAENEVRKKN